EDEVVGAVAALEDLVGDAGQCPPDLLRAEDAGDVMALGPGGSGALCRPAVVVIHEGSPFHASRDVSLKGGVLRGADPSLGLRAAPARGRPPIGQGGGR